MSNKGVSTFYCITYGDKYDTENRADYYTTELQVKERLMEFFNKTCYFSPYLYTTVSTEYRYQNVVTYKFETCCEHSAIYMMKNEEGILYDLYSNFKNENDFRKRFENDKDFQKMFKIYDFGVKKETLQSNKLLESRLKKQLKQVKSKLSKLNKELQ